MSNFSQRDPYNPTGSGSAYDQYGNARFEPVEPSGRGAYVLLAILVALGVIGGLLYFGHPQAGNDQQAQAPASHAMPTPTPIPGTPATPSHPGGTTSPSGSGPAGSGPAGSGSSGSGSATPAPTPLGGTK